MLTFKTLILSFVLRFVFYDNLTLIYTLYSTYTWLVLQWQVCSGNFLKSIKWFYMFFGGAYEIANISTWHKKIVNLEAYACNIMNLYTWFLNVCVHVRQTHVLQYLAFGVSCVLLLLTVCICVSDNARVLLALLAPSVVYFVVLELLVTIAILSCEFAKMKSSKDTLVPLTIINFLPFFNLGHLMWIFMHNNHFF